MAMSKAEFRDALTAAASAEFSHIAADEESIDYTFSDRFEQKMEKLIRFQKKSYYRWINTAAKRVAVIALACLLLFASAFSVEAVRVPIIEAVEQVKAVLEDYVLKFIETHNGIGVNGDPSLTIKKEFRLTYIPPGFEFKDVSRDSTDLSVTISYTYGNGLYEFIRLKQTVFAEDVGVSMDTHNQTAEKLLIDGKEVLLLMGADGASAKWVQEGYLMSLHYHGPVDRDTMLEMIASVK